MAHLGQAEGGEHHRLPGGATAGGVSHQGNGDRREDQANAQDVAANAPGEDRFPRLGRGPLHQAVFAGLEGQGQGRYPVGYQVHPETL